MTARIVADKDQPTAAIEIPLRKPLPDYDLEQLEQPTPRDVDAVLVTQGFRDLVDDARGVLTELIGGTGFEIGQFTGAICPGDEDVYYPGLWIVLRDPRGNPRAALAPAAQERIASVAAELVKRFGL